MHEWWMSLVESDRLLLRERALTAVDPDDLLTALRSGRLRRIQRGIYLPRRLEATPHLLARAAVLSSGVVDAVPATRPQHACMGSQFQTILETAGRLVLRDRGVPLPIPQHQLWAPDGTLVARLDGAYLREKVALAAIVQRTLRRRAS